ncbi:MAG: hypothetical protein ABI131_06785 [Nostocoides sp.]
MPAEESHPASTSPRTLLLGPQRFKQTATTALRSLATDGPVATINAGWEEREDEVGELDLALDGRAHHLRLYHRMLDVLEKDPPFAAAALAFRDRHDELLSLYRLRLQYALDGAYAVQRRRADPGDTAYGALDDAIEVVRHVDAWYLAQLASLYEDADLVDRAVVSDVIGWHRGEIAAALATAAALVLPGGDIRSLLRTLRLFQIDIPAQLPVMAWSAGAMALTDEVVLFHDQGPQGASESELYDRGLARVSGVVALPHARSRLRLEERGRSAILARRFGDRHCLLLDEGAVLEVSQGGALPRGSRVLGLDGAIHELRRA